MIKGNNQNECEHDKGSNAMGYYSPTGNDWALTGGWLNKLCSSLQRPRPLVHLPASSWNLFLRLTETTDKGADEHGNERMNMWSSWSLYFCALLFFFIQIILLSLNIVIILFFFAWRCNFGDKHLRQKTEMTWNCIFLHETLNTVVRWRRQSVSPKTTMWKTKSAIWGKWTMDSSWTLCWWQAMVAVTLQSQQKLVSSRSLTVLQPPISSWMFVI